MSSPSPRPHPGNLPLIPHIWIPIFEILLTLKLAQFPHIALPRLGFARPSLKTLRNVSLTCRSFYNLTLPIRARSITLSAKAKSSERLNRMLDFLEKEDLFGSIRTLCLSGGYKSNLPNEPLPERITQALWKMNNVSELVLGSISINSDTYSRIFTLPKLKGMYVEGVTYVGDEAELVNYPPRGLKLERLTFEAKKPWLFQDQPEVVELPMARLALATSITHLRLCDLVITSPFSDLVTPLPNLVYLRASAPVYDPEILAFYTFAARCPNLETLDLDDRSISQPYIDATFLSPAEILPNLRNLSGPLKMTKAILPGRPVHSLRFQARRHGPLQWNDTFLRPLSQGSVPLVELDMTIWEWEEAQMPLFADLFPALRDLRIMYWSGDYTVRPQSTFDWILAGLSSVLPQPCLKDTFASQISRFTQLESLYLSSPKVSAYTEATLAELVEMERAQLEALGPNQPLTSARFRLYGEWSKSDGRWDHKTQFPTYKVYKPPTKDTSGTQTTVIAS